MTNLPGQPRKSQALLNDDAQRDVLDALAVPPIVATATVRDTHADAESVRGSIGDMTRSRARLKKRSDS